MTGYMQSRKLSMMLLLLISCAFIFSCITRDVSADTNTLSSDDSTIHVGVYVISVGNFEYNKGTYVLDFYLVFKWNDQNLTPASFEFMNGRAISKEKIFESRTNDSSEVWYRIQANLFITPEYTQYPFDTQDLKLILEDSEYNTSVLSYAPMIDFNGIDKEFTIAGWEIKSHDSTVTDHEYPWGETYSSLTFTVTIARSAGPSAVKILIPPIIFCVVSGLSFFFKADKITHRIGLGTSMLISAVMFHLSQTSSLPPLPSLILVDKIMIATYAFLASSLFVTTLIYIDDEYWKDVDYTKIVNTSGGIITVVLPFLVFAILYFF
jgi:hypothetical protein